MKPHPAASLRRARSRIPVARHSTPDSGTEQARCAKAAEDAARTAGRILMERFSQAREIRLKGDRDIVTDADFAANRAIRAILEREFPHHAILSEEDAPPAPDAAEHLWIIDPLDGTTNYARQYPVFAVSIALARRGRVQVGVVYDPVRDECFTAQRGAGAFLNGAPLQAGRIASLHDAVIGFELVREQKARERSLYAFAQLAAQSMTARIGGSAALSLCYIGAARLDAYFHLSLSPWDIAAGMLVAREAGARVTHLDGHPATLSGGSYVAANRKLFPQFLRRLNELV